MATKIKRSYTIAELKETNDHMQNYTVDLKVYGCKTTMKIHTGLTGNHWEILNRITKEYHGETAQVLGARVLGRVWKEVSPF